MANQEIYENRNTNRQQTIGQQHDTEGKLSVFMHKWRRQNCIKVIYVLYNSVLNNHKNWKEKKQF